jgi:hypothetical protein
MKALPSLLLILSASISYASLTEGFDAMDRGDHKTVIFNFKEAISEEEGADSRADINKYLGITYAMAGEDIDHDYKLAF